MPRKNLIRTNTLPYHVTARTNNREDFHLDLQTMWKIFESECRSLRLLFEVEFHAFVLMPNHFHMLVTVPCEDLGVVMNTFMADVTRRSNQLTGRSGHLFGGPYHWSLVNSSIYFAHALKYIYRNPVKAKLCGKVEEYPFSTLNGLLGRSHLPFPVHFTRVGMEMSLPTTDQPLDLLPWLNEPFPNEAEAVLRKALRRQTLQNIIDPKTHRPYKLLEHLI